MILYMLKSLLRFFYIFKRFFTEKVHFYTLFYLKGSKYSFNYLNIFNFFLPKIIDHFKYIQIVKGYFKLLKIFKYIQLCSSWDNWYFEYIQIFKGYLKLLKINDESEFFKR